VSTFGDRLKKLRQKHGMTQQDLAGLFHISASAISSYETGARIPDIIFLNELAKYYNVSTDFMLGLSNNTLSFDVLNQTIIDNINYYSVFEKIQLLSDDRKLILLAIIDDLYFSSSMGNKTLLSDKK